VDAAILGRPCPLLEPADHHDPAALAQGFGGMLGLVALAKSEAVADMMPSPF
jgi:hypothetical protein